MNKKIFLRKMAVSIVAAILLLCLYAVIFSFSEQDAEASGSLSHMISERCVELINALAGGKWTEGFMASMADYFEHPIRKLAHFAEYACMGVLVYALWRPWKKRNIWLYLLVTVWVLVSAAGDEIHQLFVPGRYGCLADVFLDTCGGVFGVLCLVITEKIILKKKKASRDS